MEYINKDVFGEFALSGSIFLSCLNSPDFSDSYNLVYGHHMDNGGMFGDVLEFENTDYFEAHQTGTLYLPHKTFPVTLFACMKADAYDRLIYSPGPEYDLQELLDYLESSAVQYRDIGVTADDRIIGLSTCVDQRSCHFIWQAGRKISTRRRCNEIKCIRESETCCFIRSFRLCLQF